MSYENVPATKLLATYCACCARPLVDERLVKVRIELAGDEYIVRAPYSETFNMRLGERRESRRWDTENKAWRIKAPFRGFLFNALKASFPGVAAVGPKGAFVL